jgi:hypothetical protein
MDVNLGDAIPQFAPALFVARFDRAECDARRVDLVWSVCEGR